MEDKVVRQEVSKAKPFSDLVNVGDYISMTPTSTSYTISTSLTGYTSNQTINPSELKLWKVIRKNSDGTVDVVSEYVSTAKVYFRGKTGYLNYVGILNTIAAQYTNTKYVSKTRHFGYSNQIQNCTTLSATACPADNGWQTDVNLAGISDRSTPSGTLQSYFVSSRHQYNDVYTYKYQKVGIEGTSGDRKLVNGSAELSSSASVLPILTFKSNIQIKSGAGTVSSPYQLS